MQQRRRTNLCNNAGPVSFTCFGFGVAASVNTVLDTGLPVLASVYAVHAGCPVGSDSGTDVYQAVVQQPLTIVSVQYFDAIYQAGYNPNASATPGTAVTVNTIHIRLGNAGARPVARLICADVGTEVRRELVQRNGQCGPVWSPEL